MNPIQNRKNTNANSATCVDKKYLNSEKSDKREKFCFITIKKYNLSRKGSSKIQHGDNMQINFTE